MEGSKDMKVYFIGAGPGDPELLTVKGKRILEQAAVVIYAGSLVNPDLLEYAPQAEVYDSAELNLEEIMDIIKTAIEEDKIVARVHTGDPSLYGALQEQLNWLKQAGIEYEIIPGVSSFLAAAAAVEREYTLPEKAQTLILTRAEGRTKVPEQEELSRLASHNTSLVIFLSVQMIDKVVSRLENDYPPETPVAVVQKASWPEEKIVEGTLANIAAKVKQADIKRTALILVGDFLGGDAPASKLYDKSFSHQFRQGEQS
jgi:precorrin-4/cobalt-precorrin-4 C11-methyltransferase